MQKKKKKKKQRKIFLGFFLWERGEKEEKRKRPRGDVKASGVGH